MEALQIKVEEIFERFVNELTRQIQALRVERGDPSQWVSSYWTAFIKKIFFDIKPIEDLKVYSSLHKGEYLLDLVWSWEKSGRYKRLVLGLESEWGRQGRRARKQDVEEDFYKLLDVKCDIKVLVYCTDRDEWSGEFISGFEKILREYEKHTVGEQYLFIEFAKAQIVGYQFTVLDRSIIAEAEIRLFKKYNNPY